MIERPKSGAVSIFRKCTLTLRLVVSSNRVVAVPERDAGNRMDPVFDGLALPDDAARLANKAGTVSIGYQ